MSNFQLQNRGEVRRSIGLNLGVVSDGVATGTVDNTSLQDTKNLLGGDNEHIGEEVLIYDPTGSIVAGETSIITDFDSATNDATLAPAFSASITTGDKYERWKQGWRINTINDAINQAITDVTGKALVSRVVAGNFTLPSTYEYDWLVPYAFGNDFKIISLVEYLRSSLSTIIHNCETAWDELVDTDVTVSVDETYKIQGTNSVKLTVAAGAGAGDILATDNLESIDISGKDTVEIFIRSSVALDAGDIQLLLDDTASCASPVETIDIPATLANRNTTHVLTLASPESDTAIISVGLKMVVDKGAFKLWVDRIKAVDSGSKQFTPLTNEYWFLKRGASPRFGLKSLGLNLVGSDNEIRLSGWTSPDIFSDDTTDSEVDPAWLIARVTGRLLLTHARRFDIKDNQTMARDWLGEAERRLSGLLPSIPGGSRTV